MYLLYPLFAALPAMVCLLWTVLLLCEAKRTDAARRVLSVFSFTVTLLYACHYVYFMQAEPEFGLTDVLYTFCTLSVYPLFGIYLRTMTGRTPRPKVWLLSLLPAFLVGTLALVCYFTGRSPGSVLLLTKILIPVLVVFVCLDGAFRLRRFHAAVGNYYADTDPHNLHLISRLLYLLVGTSLATSAANLIGRDIFVGSLWVALPSLLFSTLLFSLLYVCYRQELPLLDVREEADPVAPSAPVVEEESTLHQTLFEKVEQAMRKEEIYLVKGIKITDVSEAVGSNRTYVSQCINRMAGKSFSDYINQWRISHAQELMRSRRNLSQAEIASLSGFADRVSFYRSFKKQTGESPTEWARENSL